MTIPHTTIIIIALAAGCALFLTLWLITCCCWCRSRGSKNTAIEEAIEPEPPFAPRPTVSKSSTLVSARASKRTESFLERPLQSSSSSNFASAPSELSLIPEHRPASVSMASAPRPATTYVPNEHGQFHTGSPHSHHRSVTLPAPVTFPPLASRAMLREGASVYEVQRQPIRAQHMLPPAVSMPRLDMLTQTPPGMSTPPALRLPTPFEHPPAGQIPRPETPLRNPYDDLYACLELDRDAAPTSGLRSSTPPLARSLSPTTTVTVRSRYSSGPWAAMLASTPASTPTHAPAPAPVSTLANTTAAPGLANAISGPSTSTAAVSESAPGTSAISALEPPEATTSTPAPISTRARWGPNEYPPEKREVRLEPPRQSLSPSASSSSLVREDFADCPPAYTS